MLPKAKTLECLEVDTSGCSCAGLGSESSLWGFAKVFESWTQFNFVKKGIGPGGGAETWRKYGETKRHKKDIKIMSFLCLFEKDVKKT